MSKQISFSTLELVIKKLSGKKFDEKINEADKHLTEVMLKYIDSILPEKVKELFNKYDVDVLEKYMNITKNVYMYYWTLTTSSAPLLRMNFRDKSKDHFCKMLSTVNSFACSFGKYVPITNMSANMMLTSAMEKNEDVLNAVYDLVELKYNKIQLEKKLECLFKSRRFYPNILKEEFPEAYEAYVKISPSDSYDKYNTCDSIENVRAVLQSNK